MLLSAAKGGGSSPILLVLLVLAYAAFYIFFIRPRSRKARAARATGTSVQVGDRVQTIGGLIGTIVDMDDQTVVLQTIDGAKMEFLRQAIAKQYQPPTIDEPTDGTDDHHEGDTH